MQNPPKFNNGGFFIYIKMRGNSFLKELKQLKDVYRIKIS